VKSVRFFDDFLVTKFQANFLLWIKEKFLNFLQSTNYRPPLMLMQVDWYVRSRVFNKR